MKNTHEEKIEKQFGDRAAAYLQSEVHASGDDLQRLTRWLAEDRAASLLDLGCGAGHASFVAAAQVAQVTAYDLSAKMLTVVDAAAAERGLHNLTTRQGVAEQLPFADHSFEVVISRYSAHHWRDVGMALREVRRVLKPGGKFILMDIASPGYPVLDIWLQTLEMLRDPSHVRNYSQGEWLRLINECGFNARELVAGKLTLVFAPWIARMQTSPTLASAIRELQGHAADEVKTYFAFADDGSFCSDTLMFVAC